MRGYLALVLHAHLPFVRHPEHDRFLEESWLFEAVAETYLPLIEVMEGWRRDGVSARVVWSMSPTLCAMLRDPLLKDRCRRHLNQLVELAEKEVHRTHWDRRLHRLAEAYLERFSSLRDRYDVLSGDLVRAFGRLQEQGHIEIMTCAATHGLLPLLVSHPPAVRAQVLTACDDYRACFGRDPRGIWLPECAYDEALEDVLAEAGLRWFIVDAHGLLHACPRPRYGVYAPVRTPGGLHVVARDSETARQVWSRHEGYPGDPRYRDFYRDVGFDLDLDYIQPYLPSPGVRGFTGIKYYRITGGKQPKMVYDRGLALRAADEHAEHFVQARVEQIRRLESIMDRPPLIVAPYDAELFGHWWHEGPEFLDWLVRKAVYDQQEFAVVTPEEYLRRHGDAQMVRPSASTWGEDGYLRVWLNDSNEWIYPHLQIAGERMSALAVREPPPTSLEARALRQAAREVLLAQASDWPFILRTGTCPEYARARLRSHLHRFLRLHDQIVGGCVDEPALRKMEAADNLFPEIDWRYWRKSARLQMNRTALGNVHRGSG